MAKLDISIDGDVIENGTVRFNLKTLSSALTNKEVTSYLASNISIFTKFTSQWSFKTNIIKYQYHQNKYHQKTFFHEHSNIFLTTVQH